MSAKSKRDDSFGVLARLEVCDLALQLWPTFEKAGKSRDDLLFYLRDETKRPKNQIAWAIENEDTWKAEVKRLKL